jgi:hypothetical protein
MSRYRVARRGIRDPEFVTATEEDELCLLRPAPVGSECCCAVQYIGEALELCRDGCGDRSTGRQLDVEDESRRSQANGRSLAHENPNRRVPLLPRRDLLRRHHLRTGLHLLVLSGHVHPEHDASEFPVRPVLLELIGPDRLGVPYTSSSPEREQRTLGEPRSLHRATRSGAMAGAGRPLEDVPQVVESSVRVLRVDVRQSRRPDASLVDEEEWIDVLVCDSRRRQGLQNGLPHDPDRCRILHDNGSSPRGLDLVLASCFKCAVHDVPPGYLLDYSNVLERGGYSGLRSRSEPSERGGAVIVRHDG